MTAEQVAEATSSVVGALANGAMIDGILGHSASQANRDIRLRFTAEQSRPVLKAVLAVLKAMQG